MVTSTSRLKRCAARPDRIQLSGRQFGRGDGGLDHVLGFGAQGVEHAGDFRQQRQGGCDSARTAGSRSRRATPAPAGRRSSDPAQVGEQGRAVGGDVGGERRASDHGANALPRAVAGAARAYGRASVRAWLIRSPRPARRAAPCGRWHRFRAEQLAPVTASADTACADLHGHGWRRRRFQPGPVPSDGWLR